MWPFCKKRVFPRSIYKDPTMVGTGSRLEDLQIQIITREDGCWTDTHYMTVFVKAGASIGYNPVTKAYEIHHARVYDPHWPDKRSPKRVSWSREHPFIASSC